MAIIRADSKDFDELTAEGFTIVDFFSTTCVPCRMLSGILEDLSLELPFINIVKVNITEDRALGDRFEVKAVPTVIFMKNGAEAERHIGIMDEYELKEVIAKYLYA